MAGSRNGANSPEVRQIVGLSADSVSSEHVGFPKVSNEAIKHHHMLYGNMTQAFGARGIAIRIPTDTQTGSCPIWG